VQITSVQIQRYRAFDKRVVVPISPLTVVTGANNLGKSTVLSALDLFFSAIVPRGFRRVPRGQPYSYENDYPKRYDGRSGRRWPTEIRVTMRLDEADRDSISAVCGEVPPDTLDVKVEFQWKETVGMFRPIVTFEGISAAALKTAITDWLKSEVSYVYIPATRNVQDFRRGVFSEVISGALSRVSRSKQRLQAIEKLFEDVKTEVAAVETELATELRQYLPSVKSLHFAIDDWSLERLVSVGDVEIDDGANTLLHQKGDGFKSLFSISLLQYIAKQRYGRNLIFGIEEPEAHLHSSAIYEIKSTLRTLASSFQVIVTTHSPILIQRDDIPANVIVESAGGEAFASVTRSAHNLSDIRRSLGIRPHENMTTAEVVLVVEGPTEETALPSILGRVNEDLANAFSSGRVRVLSAGSAANIPSVVRALARDAATCLVLVDSDQEGALAADKIRNSGLLQSSDVFRVPERDGCAETEFEDLFSPDIYLQELCAATDLSVSIEEFLEFQQRSGRRGNRSDKWSKVMASIANAQAMDWTSIEDVAKTTFAASLKKHATSLPSSQVSWLRGIAAKLTRYLSEAPG
jgi:putative ATP-dependent endonuclease of the OLD family